MGIIRRLAGVLQTSLKGSSTRPKADTLIDSAQTTANEAVVKEAVPSQVDIARKIFANTTTLALTDKALDPAQKRAELADTSAGKPALVQIGAVDTIELYQTINVANFGIVLRKVDTQQKMYLAFMQLFNQALPPEHPAHVVIKGEDLEDKKAPDWRNRFQAFHRKVRELKELASSNAVVLINADFPDSFGHNFCSQSFRNLQPRKGQTLHVIYFVGNNNNKYRLEGLYNEDGQLIDSAGTSVRDGY